MANDAEMQKIVSFTNAFENLFKIITDDGGIDGSIVVEDSLAVMAQLLRNDVSQRSFREMGCCRFPRPPIRITQQPGRLRPRGVLFCPSSRRGFFANVHHNQAECCVL